MPKLPAGCLTVERAMFMGNDAYFVATVDAAVHLAALAAIRDALEVCASSCDVIPFMLHARGMHRTLAEDLYSIELEEEARLTREQDAANAPKGRHPGGPGGGPGGDKGGGGPGGGPGGGHSGGPGGGSGGGLGGKGNTQPKIKDNDPDPAHARVFKVVRGGTRGDVSAVSFGSTPAAAAAATAAAGRASATAVTAAGGTAAAAAAAGKAAAATTRLAAAAGVARITVETTDPPMALVDGLLREGEAELLIAARDRLLAAQDGPPVWCFSGPEAIADMAVELRRQGVPEAETVTEADVLELYDPNGAIDIDSNHCLNTAASAVLTKHIPFSTSVQVPMGTDTMVDTLSRRVEAVTGLNETHAQYFAITTCKDLAIAAHPEPASLTPSR